jgi:hypothetical protein
MADIKAPPLSPALIKQAEFVRTVWFVPVPPGIPMASVLAPEFWVHCARSLKVGDKIECRAQDNAWYAELLVGGVGQQEARVWAVLYADLRAQGAAKPAESADNYKVEFGGPKHMWRVIRMSDKEVMHKGEASEEDAAAWLTMHLQPA